MAEPNDHDVAAILEALRAEVRSRRAAQGAGEASAALSAIERELHHAAEQLEITRVVSAHWPLEGRSLYERGWVLVNKVVRRGLKWYINPIVEQQNAFNDAATRSLRLLIEAHAELRDQLAELRRSVAMPSGPEDDRGTGGWENRDGAIDAPRPVPHPSPDEAPPTAGRPPTLNDRRSAPGDHLSTLPTAELQALVEQAGRAEPPAALPDLGLRSVASSVDKHRTVSAHWDLGGGSPLAVARALVQRAIRQYLRWLVNPIVEQQNGFNDALAAAAPHLVAIDGELRARVAAVRRMQHAALSMQKDAR